MKTARMAQLTMLCLAAQLGTLPLASMTVGLPALVGSGVSLPLATLAALVPATMIAWSLPGMSAADVAAVRNTWLMDRAALLVLIAGMMALGAVMIPELARRHLPYTCSSVVRLASGQVDACSSGSFP